MEYTRTYERFIAEMREEGVTKEGIRQKLIDIGWHPESIHAALESGPNNRQHRVVIGPDLTGLPSRITTCDSHASVIMRMHHPDVCLLGNALSDDECERIVDLARPKLHRSKVYVPDSERSNEGVVSYVRTSQQAGFRYQESELVDRIYERISTLVRWPISHMEAIHVVRYLPGADFAPHYDYFSPITQGELIEAGGQRLASIVIYLNTPESGGATSFLDVQTEIFPQRGSLLYFSYLGSNRESQTLHAGVPLGCGEKWIATLFLRDREQSQGVMQAEVAR
jgi:prolyl 4-hydroxylase